MLTVIHVEHPETYEEHEVSIEWSYYYEPGNYSGLPENCYPAEESFDWDVTNPKDVPQAVLDMLTDEYVWDALEPNSTEWQNEPDEDDW